jgi:adenosylmethionine-8-amino-7-oxononanoate aminotransferase
MAEVCKRHGALLIWDEVMCGMGRMGTTLHAWQEPNSYTDGVAPDILTLAKGLGAAYASIGAVLFNARVANGIRNGSNWLQHGHTYQTHPLACAASLAVQDVIEEENLLARCADRGQYLGRLLKEELTGPNAKASPYVFDVRGGGLFWAVEFEFTATDSEAWFKPQRFAARVQAKAMELGLVIMGMSGGVDGSRGDHIILAPAYTVSEKEVEEIVRRMAKAVEEVLQETVLSLS